MLGVAVKNFSSTSELKLLVIKIKSTLQVSHLQAWHIPREEYQLRDLMRECI